MPGGLARAGDDGGAEPDRGPGRLPAVRGALPRRAARGRPGAARADRRAVPGARPRRGDLPRRPERRGHPRARAIPDGPGSRSWIATRGSPGTRPGSSSRRRGDPPPAASSDVRRPWESGRPGPWSRPPPIRSRQPAAGRAGGAMLRSSWLWPVRPGTLRNVQSPLHDGGADRDPPDRPRHGRPRGRPACPAGDPRRPGRPVVAGVEGSRVLGRMRWGPPSPAFAPRGRRTGRGLTNVRNPASPRWRRWLGRGRRCAAPFAIPRRRPRGARGLFADGGCPGRGMRGSPRRRGGRRADVLRVVRGRPGGRAPRRRPRRTSPSRTGRPGRAGTGAG